MGYEWLHDYLKDKKINANCLIFTLYMPMLGLCLLILLPLSKENKATYHVKNCIFFWDPSWINLCILEFKKTSANVLDRVPPRLIIISPIFSIVVACTLGLIILYGTYLGTEVYGVQGDYDDIAIAVEVILVFQLLYNGCFKIIYQLTCRTLIEEEQDFGKYF